MRDPKRIKRILSIIEGIWVRNPDLRLCQLIGNCFAAGDNYHKEDNELENRLRDVYSPNKELQNEKNNLSS